MFDALQSMSTHSTISPTDGNWMEMLFGAGAAIVRNRHSGRITIFRMSLGAATQTGNVILGNPCPA